MSNLTKRHSRQHVYSGLGLFAAFIGALSAACSDNTSNPPNVGASNSGGSAGASSGSGGGGGKAGSAATAGSANRAGSGGSNGTAGKGGNGGSGGMACAADDECCDDPAKTEPGECGCGIPDVDSDTDGELNCKETCPQDPDKTEPEMCGCGVAENDSDDDGVVDCKPGHFLEAEDGVFSEENVPVEPIDDGAGGEGAGGAGSGGAPSDGGAGGASSLPMGFSTGDDAKASQGKYIESPAGFTSDAGPGPARASYEVDIAVAGDYTFWGRFYAPDIAHNRIWVKIDDGTWTKLRVTTGETWFWYTFHVDGMFETPIKYTLSKAKHTLLVASDSDGVKVDRFYVSPKADKPPGDDTTCAPPHTVPQGGVCKDSCGMLQGNSCDAVMCAGKTLLDAYDCVVCCKI